MEIKEKFDTEIESKSAENTRIRRENENLKSE